MICFITLIVNVIYYTQLTLIKPIVQYASELDLRNSRMLLSDETVYLVHVPWDYVEQKEQCVKKYHDFHRQDLNNNVER